MTPTAASRSTRSQALKQPESMSLRPKSSCRRQGPSEQSLFPLTEESDIEVATKDMYNLTESYLEDHGLLPDELLALRKDVQARKLRSAAAAIPKDKSKIAENIAKFKELAWKDIDEEVNLCIDDIDDGFLTLIHGYDVRAGKAKCLIETRILDEQMDMHGAFMRKIQQCVSRPVSAAVRSRPMSASNAELYDSNANRPIGGGPTASSLAKVKTEAKSEQTGSQQHRASEAPNSSTNAVIRISDDKNTQRPKSAPTQRFSSDRVMKLGKSPEELAQVHEYFQLKLDPKNMAVVGDKSHYKIMTLPPPTIDIQQDSVESAFSIDNYIKNYYAAAEQQISTNSEALNLHSHGRKRSIAPDLNHTAFGARRKSLARDSSFLRAVVKPSYERSKQDTEFIFNVARKLSAFKKISDLLLWQLCKVVRYMKVEAERAVFKQGDHGTAWFIVISGQVSISIAKNLADEPVFVKTVTSGEGFGDLALVNDKPRSATVIAAANTELFKVEKEDYNIIVKFTKEKESAEIFNFLKKLPIFADAVPTYVYNVAHKSSILTVEDGGLIIEFGNPINDMYFVKKGIFSMIKYMNEQDGSRRPLVVAVFYRNAYFGEGCAFAEDEEVYVSTYTIVAGDWRHFTQSELETKLAKNPSKNRPLKHRGQKYEIVALSAFEAKRSISTILELSKWATATNDDLLGFWQNKLDHKKWMHIRETEMNRFVKEKYVDPNTSIRKVRKGISLAVWK
ncbi:hypothetical protein BDR26DRAFT_855709 [Obelidium mucronatum]|nr:hypothetical protein BDR26DRAFT_855709 [Obelidium mucronatum]